MTSHKNWKSQYTVKEGKTLNFGSHKEKLGINDSQTSTKGSPGRVEICFLCPEKFTLGQCRIHPSNLQDLQSLPLKQCPPKVCSLFYIKHSTLKVPKFHLNHIILFCKSQLLPVIIFFLLKKHKNLSPDHPTKRIF